MWCLVFVFFEHDVDALECVDECPLPASIGWDLAAHFSKCYHFSALGFDDSVDAAFLGAWNYKDAILSKYPNWRGDWITHVPEVSVI